MKLNLIDPGLIALRRQLQPQAERMRQGIFTDKDTGRPYFTGYSYRTLYDWDQYFEAIVQILMGWPSEMIRNGVTIFLEHQHPTGLISRSVPSNQFHDPEHVKPFLSQIAWLVYQNFGELEWIAQEHYFSRLKRYLDYWLVEMDANRNGLSEWMSAPHTGMDNQHERAGWWLDRFSEGVDLNCYLVRECLAFSRLASLIGKPALAEEYAAKSRQRTKAIRNLLWDENDGFFYDRNARFGEPLMSQHAGWASSINGLPQELIRVKSASAFTALWAGAATPEQARRMVYDYLFDSRHFWSSFPIATLARSERWYSRDWLPADLGCNWRATTWMSTNYMTYHGLKRYGFHDLASLLAHRSSQLVKTSGDREWYDSETGEGRGLDPFWGWSLLGHFMEYEDQNGLDPTSLDD